MSFNRKKTSCENEDQARGCHSGEKYGLDLCQRMVVSQQALANRLYEILIQCGGKFSQKIRETLKIEHTILFSTGCDNESD